MDRRLSAAGLLVIICPLVLAQTGNPDKALDAKARQYEADRKAAVKAMATKYDAALGRVGATPGLTTDDRKRLRDRIKGGQATFLGSGVVAEADALPLDDVVAYARRLSGAYRPLAKAIDDDLGRADKANDAARVEALRKRKLALDGSVPGRADLTAGSVWNGTLNDSRGQNVLVRLEVKAVTGDRWEGEFRQNVGVAGHPVFQVGGSLRGNEVSYAVTKVLRGNDQLREASGFLLGSGRMVVEYAGVAARSRRTPGGPISGLVLLAR